MSLLSFPPAINKKRDALLPNCQVRQRVLKQGGIKKNLYIIQQPNIGVEGFFVLVGELLQKGVV